MHASLVAIDEGLRSRLVGIRRDLVDDHILVVGVEVRSVEVDTLLIVGIADPPVDGQRALGAQVTIPYGRRLAAGVLTCLAVGVRSSEGRPSRGVQTQATGELILQAEVGAEDEVLLVLSFAIEAAVGAEVEAHEVEACTSRDDEALGDAEVRLGEEAEAGGRVVGIVARLLGARSVEGLGLRVALLVVGTEGQAVCTEGHVVLQDSPVVLTIAAVVDDSTATSLVVVLRHLEGVVGAQCEAMDADLPEDFERSERARDILLREAVDTVDATTGADSVADEEVLVGVHRPVGREVIAEAKATGVDTIGATWHRSATRLGVYDSLGEAVVTEDIVVTCLVVRVLAGVASAEVEGQARDDAPTESERTGIGVVATSRSGDATRELLLVLYGDDVDDTAHSIRAIDRGEGTLEDLYLCDVREGDGGDVLRRRGDPVDEDGGIGLTRLEATDTDGSVEARVLDDVDAAVVLQEVGQAREARALDGLGADDLDLAGHLLQGKDGARTVDEDLVNVCGTEAIRGAC